MRTLAYLFTICVVALLGCNRSGSEKFTGLWNKDLNVQYDSIAFELWTIKGLRIPVDRKVITTPVFLRITKDGEFYKVTGYYYDFLKKTFVAYVSLPENVRFKRFDDLTLVSDNEHADIKMEERLAIRINNSTNEISFDFPMDKAATPENTKAKAAFYSGMKSGFHRVLSVNDKVGISEIQKNLQIQKAIF